MAARDRVRDRGDREDRLSERDRRAQQAAQARTNEYFVPKDGIDREVITADICRYLGNDALVRPGQYENPQTRQVQQGFFITAYRNLTTAMIADLKADSERWEAERRAASAQSRGQPSNVEYRASTTHLSRQHYGPTSENPQAAPLGYQQPSSSTPTGQVYDSAQGGYPQQSSYAQPPSAYQQSQGYAVQDSSNYYVGGHMVVDPRSARVPVTTQSSVPRGDVQYAASSSTYPPQQDSRTMYSPYQQAGVAVSSAQYSQSQDAYYGSRAVPPAGAYDTQDPYGDQRVYQDSSAWSQIPVTAASAPAVAPATSNTGSGRERDRDRERDRHAHGRSRR